MIPLVHRARLLVARHGPRLAVVLALVGALAIGAAAWTYAHPPTHQVTAETDVQTIATTVDTRAYVVAETPFWERGTWIENGSIHSLSAAPTLRLDVETAVPASEAVAVNQTVAIVYRAERADSTFWRESVPIATTERVTEDGRVTTTAVVDVGAIQSRLSRLNGELTGLGRASAAVELTVAYDTGRYERTRTRTAPLRFAGDGYWLDGPLGFEERRSTPAVRTVPGQPDVAVALPLGAIGLLSIVGAAGIAGLSRRGVDESEARRALERSRYAEWVSSGRLPRRVTRDAIPMRSLGDLVDLAIDADRRVVHDPERDCFAVIGDGASYCFDPAGGLDESAVGRDESAIGREAPEAPTVDETARPDRTGPADPERPFALYRDGGPLSIEECDGPSTDESGGTRRVDWDQLVQN